MNSSTSMAWPLPDSQVTTREEDRKYYALDWTKFFPPNARAVFFPESTDDVVRIVKWARDTRTSLVPSGGRTGLSGGAVATQNEVVVSFERMNKILKFDPFDQLVQVEAGVVTEALQKFATENGLYYPVDFAAVGSSHIGGNIATNAGGVKVVRYGLTRDWIAGLTVVTGAGEVLQLNRGLVKNASGYDLRHLFIGSEGTLGFITEAQIRLSAAPPELSVMVLGLPSLESMMSIFAEFKTHLKVTAFEMFSDLALNKVLAHHSLQKPFESETPYYLLVEVENPSEQNSERLMTVFESCVEKGWVLDGIIGQSEKQNEDLWALREYISESLAPQTPYKNDISVRTSQVTEFVKEIDEVMKAEYPTFEVVWFGHVGDGNLHINILKPADMEKADFFKQAQAVDKILFAKLAHFGGSVSAEHGIGLIKKPHLSSSRSPEEIALFKQIKKIFDPDGIINPGKIFDSNS